MQRWSDNGWPGLINQADTFVTDIPELGLVLRTATPEIGFLFERFLKAFDAAVEPVKGPVLDDWSYNYRLVRDSIFHLSCHASGTAIDVNALKHPRGVANTFTPAQVNAIRHILSEYTDSHTGISIFKWGKDFRTGVVDEMHFQIQGNADAVSRVVAMIKAQEDQLPTPQDVWNVDMIPHTRTDNHTLPVDPANPNWSPCNTLAQMSQLIRSLFEKDALRDAQLKEILSLLQTKAKA